MPAAFLGLRPFECFTFLDLKTLVSAKKWDNAYNCNIIKRLYDNVNKGACHFGS